MKLMILSPAYFLIIEYFRLKYLVIMIKYLLKPSLDINEVKIQEKFKVKLI